MTTAIRRIVMGLSCVLLTITYANADKRAPNRTVPEIVGEALMDEPNGWPWAIVRTFAERIPERILQPLSFQSAQSIGKFVTYRRTPFHTPVHGRVTICVATAGAGGSYVAIISHQTRDYPIVWDTLMPPSLINPQIAFSDLDRDSIPEILCDGVSLRSTDREWAIIAFDSSGCRIMAPRLDVSSKLVRHHRLIGKRLNILEEQDDGVYRLELLPGEVPEDWVTRTDTTAIDRRIFRYHRDIGGYLADD